jgi:hypothetical protein
VHEHVEDLRKWMVIDFPNGGAYADYGQPASLQLLFFLRQLQVHWKNTVFSAIVEGLALQSTVVKNVNSYYALEEGPI